MLDPAHVEAGSPWHQGEIAIQESAGVVEQMAPVGRRAIRDHLIEQHRAFFPQLPFIVIGAVDPVGDVWATLISGRPGFLHAPDPLTLDVSAQREPGDPADAGLGDGQPVGLLGIELHTRRRNRLNGTIRRHGADGFAVEVRESFGNCPQYIRLRRFAFVRDPAEPSTAQSEELQVLDEAARAMIASAETLFIASFVDTADRGRQVDVSHRGGRPGFVRVDAEGTLTIPDFAGNNFFNTLGNIRMNPRAGLVFVDFASGDLLQLTGEAEVVLDDLEIAAFQGAERLLRVRPRRIVRRPGALPLRWTSDEGGASPNAALTGDWNEAARRLLAQASAMAWRPMRVAKVVEESAAIRSLHLQPADGGALLPHRAGQHLPVRFTLPGSPAPVRRAYTISAAPSDRAFRISVRAQGAVSRRLHELQVGDEIEALAPAGGFTIDAGERRTAVLLAAGIGVTPMVALLRHIVFEALRTRQTRPTVLFYAARSRAERAFDDELSRLVKAGRGAVRLVRLLTDVSGAVRGRDYEIEGRLALAVLKAHLAFDDYDFYLCGPGGFMQDIHDGLRSLSIPEERIHAEIFGPSSLEQHAAPGDGQPAQVSERPVTVAFAPSGREARWTPSSGTLLELAEASGLSPPFGCRSGTCGTCRAQVTAGWVAHQPKASAPVADSEALLCSSMPSAAGGDRLELRLA